MSDATTSAQHLRREPRSRPGKKRAGRKRAPGQTQVAEKSLTYGSLVEEYHDPYIARRAVKIGALAVVGFLGWAAVSPVHELTVGQGEILPTGFVQRIQHFEGGNVSQILVREGQVVNAGQPLVQLDDVSVRAELTKAQSRLEFLRLAIQRQTNISGDDESDLFSYESERFAQLLQSQQMASEVDSDFRDAQRDVLAAELQMKTAEMDALRTRVQKINEEFELVAQQLLDYEEAVQSGAISRRERDAVLRDKLRLESERAALEGQLSLAEAAVLEARARASELDARFRQQAVVEIADLELQKAETQELVAQLESRLDRLTLRAPVDGTVNNLSVRNAGQIVSPGEMVAEVVPVNGSVFAEVDIPTDQIGFVRQGMSANVKVLTYDFARFGSIEGTVVDVSPSSLVGPEGNYFYRVRLELDDVYVGDAADDRRISPGMAVTADIRLGEKSVLSYLLKPLRAISDRAFSER